MIIILEEYTIPITLFMTILFIIDTLRKIAVSSSKIYNILVKHLSKTERIAWGAIISELAMSIADLIEMDVKDKRPDAISRIIKFIRDQTGITPNLSQKQV